MFTCIFLQQMICSKNVCHFYSFFVKYNRNGKAGKLQTSDKLI